MGDPKLAEIMRSLKVKAPIERIVREVPHETAMSITSGSIKANQRVVVLECGHTEVTRARKRAACRQCHEMILNGEDYDAFRNHRGAA